MFKRLRQFRVVPMVTVKNEKEAISVAEALTEGGLPAMELNYRTHRDHKVIKTVRKKLPDFWVGTGGILNTDLLFRAIAAQACFATAPGVNSETIREAFKREFSFAPGVCTPSDIENALLNGISNFQFFPAEAAGGARMLKAIMNPFRHLSIEFMPKGDIQKENLEEYLKISKVAAVSVDWIVPPNLIRKKDWQALTANAQEARDLIKAIDKK